MYRLILIIMVTLGVAGCGQTGALYLPEEPQENQSSSEQ